MPSRTQRKKYDRLDVEEGDGSEINAKEEDLISIQVKLPEEQIKEINVALKTTIKEFRRIIKDITDIEPDRQRLIHFGKMLASNEKTLEAYGVKNGDFIHLMPLPKDVSPSRIASRGGIRNDINVGPLPDIPGLSVEFMNNLSNEEYFQMIELNLWRARVRLLSSLMLFYYFLQLLGNLSLWFNPEEKQKRFAEGHAPSDLFFGADLVECLIGGMAAMTGMMAATSQNSVNSAIFLRTTVETGIMHFVTFVIYSHELLSGRIEINPEFSHQKPIENNQLEKEAIRMGVVFSFMVNFFIWWSILSIAIKYHQALQLNFPQSTNEGEAPEEESVIVEEAEIV